MRFCARLLVAAAVLCSAPAFAAETGGCSRFAWPIEPDIALLEKAVQVRSGAALPAPLPAAARVVMVDAAAAGFKAAPTREPPPAAPAGSLLFEARAGTYQFTVTDRVWIDVVQDGRALDEGAFSGVLDCDGARKSVRFELKDGPALIQLSNSPTRAVSIAVSRVEK